MRNSLTLVVATSFIAGCAQNYSVNNDEFSELKREVDVLGVNLNEEREKIRKSAEADRRIYYLILNDGAFIDWFMGQRDNWAAPDLLGALREYDSSFVGPPYIPVPHPNTLRPNRGADPGKPIPSRILLSTDYNKSVGT